MIPELIVRLMVIKGLIHNLLSWIKALDSFPQMLTWIQMSSWCKKDWMFEGASVICHLSHHLDFSCMPLVSKPIVWNRERCPVTALLVHLHLVPLKSSENDFVSWCPCFPPPTASFLTAVNTFPPWICVWNIRDPSLIFAVCSLHTIIASVKPSLLSWQLWLSPALLWLVLFACPVLSSLLLLSAWISFLWLYFALQVLNTHHWQQTARVFPERILIPLHLFLSLYTPQIFAYSFPSLIPIHSLIHSSPSFLCGRLLQMLDKGNRSTTQRI